MARARTLPPDPAPATGLEVDRVHVHRYLLLLGCGSDEADDLTQEVFVRFLSAHWAGPTVARRAWLRRTARHLWLQRVRGWRRARRERAWADEVDAAVAERWSDDGEAFTAALGTCMGRLSERAGSAIRLRHEQGLDRAAIGARLGLAVGGVKTLLERTRRFLRECITQEVAEEMER